MPRPMTRISNPLLLVEITVLLLSTRFIIIKSPAKKILFIISYEMQIGHAHNNVITSKIN